MKPTAVKWCIIEIKGHEDIRVSLFTLTTVTDSGGRLLGPEIMTFFNDVPFILKGQFHCV